MSYSPVSCPDPICKIGQITVPDNVEVGDILECPNCAAEVEVIDTDTDPIEIELLLEEK